MKELGNFAQNNVRFPDLRVKSLRGGPARPMVSAATSATSFTKSSVDSRRDFFLRMTSFSLGLGADTEGWKEERDNFGANCRGWPTRCSTCGARRPSRTTSRARSAVPFRSSTS